MQLEKGRRNINSLIIMQMETIFENETLGKLLEDMQIVGLQKESPLVLLAETDHRYLRDLRINVSNALNYPNLSKKDSLLIALSVAANEKNELLKHSILKLIATENVSDAELAETFACVSLMNVNNVFYRFRHFAQTAYYNDTPAGIKMNVMMNPVLGKELFELMSLALSAVNGCEMCVKAHEESVKKHGATEARIYDAVRLAAVIKGFAVIL